MKNLTDPNKMLARLTVYEQIVYHQKPDQLNLFLG